jgi:hypothetical protein
MSRQTWMEDITLPTAKYKNIKNTFLRFCRLYSQYFGNITSNIEKMEKFTSENINFLFLYGLCLVQETSIAIFFRFSKFSNIQNTKFSNANQRPKKILHRIYLKKNIVGF